MADRRDLARTAATAMVLALSLAIWATEPVLASPDGLLAAHADIRSLGPMPLDEALPTAQEASREVAESLWLAYRVESVPSFGSLWCHHSCCSDLEHDDSLVRRGRPEVSSAAVLVLLRIREGEVGRIRAVSEDCPIGFSGRTVLWAGDIEPSESLALLRRWIDVPRDRLADSSLADGALTAIAHHRGDEASDLLGEVASTSASTDLARNAAFWLGVARGRGGYDRLVTLLPTRPELEIRKGIVFALSQSREPEAPRKLVALAREDADPELRREALFWLGQEGSEFSDVILDAVLTESDQQVAKHAVFVLSQLPEPESLELLSRVLVQQQRPELRKEALFWIGQSRSPEALDIVTRILNQ